MNSSRLQCQDLMMAAADGQYTLSQMSHAVEAFVKVLRLDTEKLEQHKKSIKRFKASEDWVSLNKEQINASRSVQQLKANILELGNARCQIRECDQPLFDKKVEKAKNNAQHAISELLSLQNGENLPIQDHAVSTHKPASNVHREIADDWLFVPDEAREISSNSAFCAENLECLDTDNQTAKSTQIVTDNQMLMLVTGNDELERQRIAEESWDNLRQSLEDLNEVMQTLAKLVHAQQDKVDTIEDNIEHAAENVSEGTQQLADAAKSKAAMLPVAGAAIGSIFLPPLGTFVGYKIGKFIQKQKVQSIDADMAELKEKIEDRKTSKPELSLDDLKQTKKK